MARSDEYMERATDAELGRLADSLTRGAADDERYRDWPARWAKLEWAEGCRYELEVRAIRRRNAEYIARKGGITMTECMLCNAPATMMVSVNDGAIRLCSYHVHYLMHRLKRQGRQWRPQAIQTDEVLWLATPSSRI